MAYTVHWKTLPGKMTIRTEVFEDRDEAIAEAEFAQISGPHPVEVSVTDDAGEQHYVAVFG
ncbi:hypothetical protein FJY63_03325 [Candidatus Sumerlaeota bacterium]|nr:hypothetical protein [Candidatus Sumerlaeota bacterium]